MPSDFTWFVFSFASLSRRFRCPLECLSNSWAACAIHKSRITMTETQCYLFGYRNSWNFVKINGVLVVEDSLKTLLINDLVA